MSVTPFMPDHGHGTSLQPKVTSQGNGRYAISPVYFFMPGVWRVGVTLQVNGRSETVNFFFCVAG